MQKKVMTLGLLVLLAAASGAQTHQLQLSWSETSSAYTEIVRFDRTEPFSKEPQSTGGKLLRAVLSMGHADCKADVGLLWDVRDRKLYVDLNADGDLTNDGDPLTAESVYSYYQSFGSFSLSLDFAEGKRWFRLSPLLRDAPWSTQAQLSVSSIYTGDIDLYGQTWQINVWDSLKSPLTEALYFTIFKKDDNADPGHFAMPQNLCVGGRCYDVALQPQQADDGRAGLICVLTECTVPTGTLAIKGQWIHSVVLEGQNMLIVPELTQDTVVVPAGIFEVKRLILQAAPDKPAFGPIPWGWEKTVTIVENQTAELAIGGPLKQSVDITRTGSTLSFSYALKGAGGEPYDIRPLYNYDHSKKPSVTIYKGDMQLAKGSFEYG
jgi:hypothetical protein